MSREVEIMHITVSWGKQSKKLTGYWSQGILGVWLMRCSKRTGETMNENL